MGEKRDFLAISDLRTDEVYEMLDLTAKVKVERKKYVDALKGRSIGLIFQKPSNRTRVSFEIGMVQLGGYAIYLGPSEISMGARESVKDVARVLSRYLDGIVARTFRHGDVVDLARHATVPVINGLSDMAHPCQALSDVYTIRERFGSFKGLTLAYVGDGNNVLNSLVIAAAKVGLDTVVASPKGYEPEADTFKKAQRLAKDAGSKMRFVVDPREAVGGADIVYTDVWVSMGQEGESAKRERAFKKYQVNDALMKNASGRAVVMHCLPAHRGLEITDAVIDSSKSIVYDQAENRMHAEKAILLKLLS